VRVPGGLWEWLEGAKAGRGWHCVPPSGCLLPAFERELELGHLETEQRAGDGFEVAACPSEEGGCSPGLEAAPLVKRGRELHQRLEEMSLGALRSPPAFLPSVMRSVKLAPLKTQKPSLDGGVEWVHGPGTSLPPKGHAARRSNSETVENGPLPFGPACYSQNIAGRAHVADVIKAALTFFLSEFSLTFFVLGLVFSAVALARAPKPLSPAMVVEKLLSWHVFFVIGVLFLYNFVCHVFLGAMSARFIGWADSPFQFEVGTASLGFSVVGFIAAFRGFELRVAAIVAPAIFTLGAACGHVYQMVTAHNFAPGNAGLFFYMDIIIPLFGCALLWLQHRYGPPQANGQPSSRAKDAAGAQSAPGHA
jgi:hypothetical protein